MESEDAANCAKGSIAVVREIMRAAGDNPDVRDAGRNLGKTAKTLTEAVNIALLPIAAVNFGYQKAKSYFSTTFSGEMEEKLSAIPDDKLVEPEPSIAGPALQGLAFAHEDPQLKEMFLSLIATSMDERVKGLAHPAFVETIRQLSGKEAKILSMVLSFHDIIPIAQIRRREADTNGYAILKNHVIDFISSPRSTPIEYDGLPAMVDNWIRLGLVVVDYTVWITKPGGYAWVKKRPEFLAAEATLTGTKNVIEFQPGALQLTAHGRQFASAVGVDPRRP